MDGRKRPYQELAEDTDAHGRFLTDNERGTATTAEKMPPSPLASVVPPAFVLFIPGLDREQMLPKFVPSQLGQRWPTVLASCPAVPGRPPASGLSTQDHTPQCPTHRALCPT